MSVESINAGQQVVNAQKREIAKEEEVKTQVQSKGSTKDVIATLGILASIGIAAVAIIKSKNAKKELQEALKKAEEEKNKLAEEAKKAAEDAKKAAEDVNKKVEEAVNKAKEELKSNKPHSGGGRPKTSGGREKSSVPTRTTREAAPVEPKPAPTHAEATPIIEPKPITEVKPEPVVEPKPTPTPAASAHVKPTPIVEPKPTAEVKPDPVVKPKVEAPKVEAPKAEMSEVEVSKAEMPTIEEQIAKAELDAKESDMVQVARNIIDTKPAPQAIDVLGDIDLSKPLNRMSEKELLFEYNALKDVVKNMSVTDPATKRFLEIKGELVNKRAFKVTKDGITKREGVLDDYTKEGLEIINKQEADAKKALEESNARNAKWIEEQQAKREAEYEQMYLNAEKEKIDGLTKQLDEQEAAAKKALEESNARNAQWVEEQRAIKQDEYEAMYLNAERERDIANGARVLERGNLDIYLDEVYPGYTRQLEEGKNDIIFVPRATKLSDGVQKVTDFVSEKWGKFRGLFGKKKPVETQPEPKPFKPSAEGVAAWAEHLKNKRIEEGKQVKEQVAKQLRDNTDTVPVQEFIDSKVPRKHNKRYHDKLQKEYDKMAEGIKEHKPIRQPIAEKQEPAVEIKEELKVETPKPEVAETPKADVPKAETPKVEHKAAEKPVVKTARVINDEMSGLSDVEKLLVERDGLLANQYGQHSKRIKEINEQLATMGKANAKLGLSDANSERVNIARLRAEQQNWVQQLEKSQEQKTKLIQELEAKGLKPIEATDAEIELQVEYVSKIQSSAHERSKGDIEWAEKYATQAQKYSDGLAKMGKKPIDRTTQDMQIQFQLFQAKDSINKYTRWIKDCDKSIQDSIAKLKEILKTSSEGAQKKNKSVISEQKKAADGMKYLDKQEAEVKKALEESNARNAQWVEAQRAKSEADYEQMFLKAEAKYKAEKEAKAVKEGLNYLDKQEAEAKKALEESNARNAEWVKEQKALKQNEYEAMYLEAEAERNAAKEAEEAAKSIAKESPEAINELSRGVNQLPESFNQEQLSWLKAHGYIRDNVTEYPKLYSVTHGKIEIPLNILTENQIEFFTSNGFVKNGDILVADVSKSLPKDKKALQKLMKKLDHEHKTRRIEDASRRVGIGNETAFYNPIDVPKDIRYNYRKYKSMELERPNDADWEPEMTRDELMQNIEQYMNEEIARTRIHHHETHKKQSFLQKLKNKIGL